MKKRSDKERLDWMEKNMAEAMVDCQGKNIHVMWGWGKETKTSKFMPSLRQAIDAAMRSR